MPLIAQNDHVQLIYNYLGSDSSEGSEGSEDRQITPREAPFASGPRLGTSFTGGTGGQYVALISNG